MHRELTLSQEVRVFIDGLDGDDTGLTPEDFAESQKPRQLIAFIVDDLIKSREILTDSKLDMLERIVRDEQELVEGFLDDRFTRDVVDAVPGYVRRTLELSRLRCDRVPSNTTNGYLREAVRTYIMGLPQASVALSRAALEQALKEGIGYQSTNTFVRMNNLLDEAETAGVLDHANRDLARQVADAADDVLHEKPTVLPKALDVLIKLRGVLEFVYS